MSDLMNTLGIVKTWWNEQGQDALNKRSTFDEAKSRIDKDIAAIDTQKLGLNPLKSLRLIWTRATALPELKKFQSDLQSDIANIDVELESQAKAQARELIDSYAASNKWVADTLAYVNAAITVKSGERSAIEEIAAHTEKLIKRIKVAEEACENAQGWEVVDMIGNNAFTTIYSHGKTSDASEQLQGLSDALNAYKEFMEIQKQQIHDIEDTIFGRDKIDETAQWDLWMGVLDVSVISIYTSFKNHEQLGKAREQVKALPPRFAHVLERCGEEIAKIDQQIEDLEKQYQRIEQPIIKQLPLPPAFFDYYNRGKYQHLLASPYLQPEAP